MTLMRMPLSVWGIFVATILGLFAFPALFVSAIMMAFDHLLGTSFFMPAMISLGESVEHAEAARSCSSIYSGSLAILRFISLLCRIWLGV